MPSKLVDYDPFANNGKLVDYDPFAENKPVKPRSYGEAVTDVGAGLVSGLGSLVQLPGQLYGLGTGNFEDTGLLGLGKAIQKKGESWKSEELKGLEAARAQKIKEAEKQGWWEEFKTAAGETLKNPALLTSFLAEQAPQLLVPFGIGKGASAAVMGRKLAAGFAEKKAAEEAGKFGVKAAIGAGSVQQGADIGTDTYEEVYRTQVAKGVDPATAKQTALNLARASGASAALISLLSQRLPGAKTLEESFLGVPGKTGRIVGGIKGLLGEAGQEMVEEGGGKFGQNLAVREVNPEQDLFKGVGTAAGLAAIGGGAFGAVGGIGRRPAAPEAAPAPETKPPQQQPLLLPAPQQEIMDMRQHDPVMNPLGNFVDADLKGILTDDQIKFINEDRKNNGKPPLSSYSIEDVQDAINNSSNTPEAKQGALDALLAFKTGYDGSTPIGQQEVLEMAGKKNVETNTSGFTDFLRRTTGNDDLNTMSPPQLYAAWQALGSLDESPSLRVLPNGTNALRFSEDQYKTALADFEAAYEGEGFDRVTAIEAIKAATGLTQDNDAEALYRTAVRNGDLEEETVKTESGLDTLVHFAGQPAALPEKMDIRHKAFKQGEEPSYYEIRNHLVPQGRADTAEEAQSMLEEQTKVNLDLAKAHEQEAAAVQKEIDANNQILAVQRGAGYYDTDGYRVLEASLIAKNRELQKRLDVHLNTAKNFSNPLTIVPVGTKPKIGKKHVVYEEGKPTASFETKAQAEEHAIQKLSDEKLQEIIDNAPKEKGVVPKRLAHAASQELKRRRGELPEGIQVKRSFKPEVSQAADNIRRDLLPFLKKIGLESVGLRIVESINNGTADGTYAEKLITLAMDTSKETGGPMGALRHESIHALKELGAFTQDEWRVLQNKAKSEWVKKFISDRGLMEGYRKVFKGDPKAFEEFIQEEAIAEAFRYFNNTNPPAGMVGNLFNRLGKFFEALKNAFKGAGFKTSDDVFQSIEQGKIKPTVEAKGEAKMSLRRPAVRGEIEISTQNASGANAKYDPISDMLSIDQEAVEEAMADNPEMKERTIDAILSYGFIPINTPREDAIRVFKENIVNNLKFLYKKVPQEIRDRSKLWYDGANRLAEEMAVTYGVTLRQVAGVMAAMSPQKDWFQNVSMAERALDILTKQGDSSWTPQMLEYANSYVMETKDIAEREKRQIDFDRIKEVAAKGTKLKDMSVKDASRFVRAFDEAFNSREYRIVTPEGGFGDLVRNDDGKPSTMMWSTYVPIEKTIRIFRNGSRSNVSQQLGFEHKIRSFYNNIAKPDSVLDHVTIDTHAVAAALMEALAGTDIPVKHNFGGTGKNKNIGVGGTYGIIADAYREAAKEFNISAREMQSITWEAVRGLFSEEIKKGLKKPIRAEWDKYRTGQQSFEATRDRIVEIAREKRKKDKEVDIPPPDWVGTDEGQFISKGGASYDKEFKPEGGVRLREINEIRQKTTVNLSAATSSILGIREIYEDAMKGNAKAYEVLQRVAESRLKYLLQGTKAKIKIEYAKGVYQSDREPSIAATITFNESDKENVLAALGWFAYNFNQQQVHVRTGTSKKDIYKYSDGSFAVPIYTIKFEEGRKFTNEEIGVFLRETGLTGFSVGQEAIQTYFVPEQGNTKAQEKARYEEFANGVRRLNELAGRSGQKASGKFERLYVYGDGGIAYDTIRGDIPSKTQSDQATARLIAEYVKEGAVKPSPQKPLTKSQEENQKLFAKVFEALPVLDLKLPLTRRIYAAMAEELIRQYKALPIKVELVPNTPYANSAAMREDVSLNNWLRVQNTDKDNFGPKGKDFSNHPLLKDSGLKDVRGKPLLINDLLRAVHDYFAHNISEAEFGPRGEWAAWRNHMAVTNNPLARWGITMETRAQNSWQNFRKEAEGIPVKDRPYAEQKASTPPVFFTLTGDEDVDAPMMEFIKGLSEKEKLGSLSTESPLAKDVLKKTNRAEEGKKFSLRVVPKTPEITKFMGKTTHPDLIDENGNPRMWLHGTARDITEFRPKQAGSIFLTRDPMFAEGFTDMSEAYMAEEYITDQLKNLDKDSREYKHLVRVAKLAAKNVGMLPKYRAEFNRDVEEKGLLQALKENAGVRDQMTMDIKDTKLESKANIMPLIVRSEKPWDYTRPDQVAEVLEYAIENSKTDKEKEHWKTEGKYLAQGIWTVVEHPLIQEAIKKFGYDGFFVKEHGIRNFAVYNPAHVKSATGNRGTFDITNPDIRYSLRAPKTAEFKRWFGDSKVVDADGNPMVVYHGTTNDFAKFEASQAGKSTGHRTAGWGFFFSSNPQVAEIFAGKFSDLKKGTEFGFTSPQGLDKARVALGLKPKNVRRVVIKEAEFEDSFRTGGNLMPVYLSIDTPKEISAEDFIDRFVSGTEDPKAFVENAYNSGYDGIVIRAGKDAKYKWEGSEYSSDAWVAFDPTQIKSATGNRGTFSPTNPDIRYSIRANLNPTVNTMIDNTTYAREQKGWFERLGSAFAPGSAEKYRQAFVNRYAAIERQSKQIAERFGNQELFADVSAIAATLMSDRAAGVTAATFKRGVPVFRNGFTTVDDSVPGLMEVLDPLVQMKDPEAFRVFQFYAATRRGSRLNAQGVNTQFTQAEIAEGRRLEAQFPEFKKVFDDYQNWNKAFVKYMVDTGVITPQQGIVYTQNADYVPFYRQMNGEDVAGPSIFYNLGNVKPPKKLKGGTEKIGDFLETLVQNSRAAIESGMRNEAANRVVRDAVRLGTAVPTSVTSGVDIVTVHQGGQKIHYQVDDPLLIEAMKGMNLGQLPFMGLLSAPANLLRSIVTKDPGYMLANLLRDSLSSWVTSGTKTKPLVDSFTEFAKAVVNKSPEAAALARAGMTGYEFTGDVQATAEKFRKELLKGTSKTVLGTAAAPVKLLIKALEQGTHASDMATRAAVYKRVLAETGNEAEAIYQAMEVLNFSRRGNSAVIRILSAAIPFMNSRIQGLDVLYRAGFGKSAMENRERQQRAFIMRGLTLMGLSLAYWFAVHDDDDYKKLTEEEKDNNWIIPGLEVDGKPFKFPIPFEVGLIFKTFPERVAQLASGEDGFRDFAKSTARGITNTLWINPIPQAALPVVEAMANYSFYTQSTIVGQGKAGLLPEKQVNQNTTEIAKGIGETFGVSPIKVDHAIRGYFGGIGMYAATALDSILSSQGDKVDATQKVSQMPVIKRFIATDKGTINQFYELKDKVDATVQTLNNLKRTDPEEIRRFVEDNKGTLALKNYVNLIGKHLQKVHRARDAVNASKTMDADQKRETLDRLHEVEVKLTANAKEMRMKFSD